MKVRYRATLFGSALLFAAGAFAGLTLLVVTAPALSIDLQITKAVQWITFPPFALLMRLVSWPGFNPQVMIINHRCAAASSWRSLAAGSS